MFVAIVYIYIVSVIYYFRSAVIILFVNLKFVSSPNLVSLICCFFAFCTKICSTHASSDVTMVDHVYMFKTDREDTFP